MTSLKRRAEGSRLLRQHDDKIAELERALKVAQDSRREVVNRYGLNKPLSA